MNEEELRRSEARFRALAEASPAGIFVAEDRRLTYVNPALAEITGYPWEELIGRDPLHLVHPDDRPDAEARVLRERSDGGVLRHEVRVHTRAGEVRWLDLTTTAVGREKGVALVGIGIEITGRKQFEQSMAQRQPFEAIGRLAGGVAHDFNNLLLVIGGQVERLLDRLPAGDPLRQAAHEIERATERAATLTEHLLAFGRRQTLHARTVDVGELLDQVADRLGREGGDPVRPIVRRPDHLPPVHADRLRLEQVLRSLYANARDAMPEGGEVIMTADLVRVDEPMRAGRPWLPVGGTWVRLRIADSGPGIPASVLPRVFEPFFTTRRAGSGAGLGLSTVYGIVKQSAGYVWVDSEPGAGTCVTVLLPPGAPVPRIVDREPPTPAPRPRVLLVEDQDGVRELLTTVLQRNGFDVVSAASGEAAVDRASETSFDILLTDVVLPGMTGPDVARRIRQQAPRIQVLFMSGYTGDTVLDTAEFGGEASFIQKPFASKALIARLRDMLTPRADDPGLPATSSR
jgi:two-component system, cell cycle sensor histidine kinase and response regulator CckA